MISRVDFSTGAAVGEDGAATSTGHSSIVHGSVLAVYVDYQGSPPAGTTDFTLSDESDPSSDLIVSLTNAATDIKLYPRHLAEKNDGTDGSDAFVPYVVHGRLEATIAGADADDYCDVIVWIRQ